MNQKLILIFVTAFILVGPALAFAHRSGCHRWHSCPSDSGSYTCGDAGHPCSYPTYPASGGVIYPSDGYYKDCYDCAWKKVPSFDSRLWSSPLQNGSSGVEVTRLQKALKTLGLFQGEFTGYFGPVTETAVKEFQRRYAIVSSGSPSTTGYGRAGWATISKLNSLYDSENDFSTQGAVLGARTCPLNAHPSATDIVKCDCDAGFSPNASLTECVSAVDQAASNHLVCHNHFGLYSYWDGTKAPNGSLNCSCQSGYVWNSAKTSCVVYAPPVDHKKVGEDFFKSNKTCVGLSGDQFGHCMSYAVNH